MQDRTPLLPDEDFYRRPPSRRAGDAETVGPVRFFQTAAGPGGSPYPQSGLVVYAQMLKNVSFPLALGATTVEYSLTGVFDFLGLATGPIPPVGSVCKAIRLGARWWIDAVVSGPNSFARACSPWECVYPPNGGGNCDGLLPDSSLLPNYTVDFGTLSSACGNHAGGIKTLRYVADCEWRSLRIDCGDGNLWFWKLTIDPFVELPAGGDVGQVVLQLYDAQTGMPVDPPLAYCINGGYPLWCGNCANPMQICCGVGAGAETWAGFPARICVHPLGANPDCNACINAGEPQLATEYLLTTQGGLPVEANPQNDCCQLLFAEPFSCVVEWVPWGETHCTWVSPWIGIDCYDVNGQPYGVIFLLQFAGADQDQTTTAWKVSAWAVPCNTAEGPRALCDQPLWIAPGDPAFDFALPPNDALLLGQWFSEPGQGNCPIVGNYMTMPLSPTFGPFQCGGGTTLGVVTVEAVP